MKYLSFKKNKPQHKELVITWDGNILQPAIYYNNQSVCGFYKFTSFYQDENDKSNSPYKKVHLKPKHEIKNIISWAIMEKPKK